jgi:hypothetical protein
MVLMIFVVLNESFEKGTRFFVVGLVNANYFFFKKNNLRLLNLCPNAFRLLLKISKNERRLFETGIYS